eukprot:752341_1
MNLPNINLTAIPHNTIHPSAPSKAYNTAANTRNFATQWMTQIRNQTEIIMIMCKAGAWLGEAHMETGVDITFVILIMRWYKTLKSVQLLDNLCWGKIARLNWSSASDYLYCICGDAD